MCVMHLFILPELNILEASLRYGHLIVGLCENILSRSVYYGSSAEYDLANNLIEAAQNIPGAQRFTLKIDGIVQGLPKGSLFNGFPLQ